MPPPPALPPPERCVYTVMTGGYEALNEQPMAARSALPFLCFTDDPDLRSQSWQMRPLEMLLSGDPLRSQRVGKIRPHRLLPGVAQSLYIDNSVLLTEPPERIFGAVDLSAGLAVPQHSFRDSVLDEFLAVAQDGLDDSSRVFEQMNQYALEDPDCLALRPLWSAILLRDHRHAATERAMEIWLAHVLRYSRRDQLSSWRALRQAGVQPTVLPIDNYRSWFHTWPHTERRRLSSRLWSGTGTLAPLAARLRAAEQQVAALQQQQASTAEALAQAQAYAEQRNQELAQAQADTEAARADAAAQVARADAAWLAERAALFAKHDRVRDALTARARAAEAAQAAELARLTQAFAEQDRTVARLKAELRGQAATCASAAPCPTS